MFSLLKKGLLLPLALAGGVYISTVPVAFAGITTQNPYVQKADWGETEDVKLIWTWTSKEDSFITVVKWAVNWVLGILALIALLYLMWGWFQMVTSGGDDDKYGAWFTILKHGATGLILIGVAWFIISIIFWLVNVTTDGAGTAWSES